MFGVSAGIREQLHLASFFDKVDESALFVSIHDAVLAAFQNDTSIQDKVHI